MAERRAPSRAFVVVDADNTLWDTNAVYANAQLALLSAVEEHVGVNAAGDRLTYLRNIDQALAQRHPQRRPHRRPGPCGRWRPRHYPDRS